MATPTNVATFGPALSARDPADDESAIREVIDSYGRAIESKDVTVFEAFKPNISDADRDRLKQIFPKTVSNKVSIVVDSIQIEGSRATVHVSRQDTIDGKNLFMRQTIILSKKLNRWVISELGQ
jgi:hypothetical protein